jgi:hypothetical protein
VSVSELPLLAPAAEPPSLANLQLQAVIDTKVRVRSLLQESLSLPGAGLAPMQQHTTPVLCITVATRRPLHSQQGRVDPPVDPAAAAAVFGVYDATQKLQVRP